MLWLWISMAFFAGCTFAFCLTVALIAFSKKKGSDFEDMLTAQWYLANDLSVERNLHLNNISALLRRD